jgi:hypothetical protein
MTLEYLIVSTNSVDDISKKIELLLFGGRLLHSFLISNEYQVPLSGNVNYLILMFMEPNDDNGYFKFVNYIKWVSF